MERFGNLARRQIAIVSFVLCCMTPQITIAAPPDASAAAPVQRETAEYKEAIRLAIEEFQAGNYAEARGHFLKAHAVFPNARTFRGLGLVAFELRNYGVCIESLQASLASDERPLTEALRRDTEQTLTRARAYVARIDVDVSPQAARVLVDGVQVELGADHALVLEVGDHLVEVQAAGYLPERRSLSIGGGEQLTLHVVMHQPESVSSIATHAPGPLSDQHRDDSDRRRWYRNPWLWAGAAVVVVGVGLGVGFALRPEAKTEVSPPPTTGRTPANGTFQALGSW